MHCRPAGSIRTGCPCPTSRAASSPVRARRHPRVAGSLPAIRVAGDHLAGRAGRARLALPEFTVKLPDDMSVVEAAGVYMNYATAWYAYDRARVEAPASTCCVHGGAAGVGTAALDLAALARGPHGRPGLQRREGGCMPRGRRRDRRALRMPGGSSASGTRPTGGVCTSYWTRWAVTCSPTRCGRCARVAAGRHRFRRWRDPDGQGQPAAAPQPDGPRASPWTTWRPSTPAPWTGWRGPWKGSLSGEPSTR